MGCRVVFYCECERVCQQVSCGSVHLRIINSCMPESWYMSIQIGRRSELINRELNGLHAAGVALQGPERIYERGASPGQMVRVDAGVHACAPARGWVVGKIGHLPILGGGGKLGWGERGWERPALNAVRGRKTRK